MTSSPKIPIRIFLSSPGDVNQERDIALDIIKRLNDNVYIQNTFVLEPLDYRSSVAPEVGDTPQRTVDQYMQEATQADIVICMLWNRMGTPVIDTDGTEYPSGTAYEFITAYNARVKANKPRILLFRSEVPQTPSKIDTDQLAEVNKFFKRFVGASADFQGLYKTYDNYETFENDLEKHLFQVIHEHFVKPLGNSISSVQRPPKVSVDLESALRISYLDWLSRDLDERLKESIHGAHFIELGMEEKLNATLPWTYRSYIPNQVPRNFEQFDEVFKEYKESVLILGQPGSGKTTTLLHTAQVYTHKAQTNQDEPLPIVVSLANWRDENSVSTSRDLFSGISSREIPSKPTITFAQWVSKLVAKIPVKGKRIPEELALSWIEADRKVALFLDGLDEIEEGQRSAFVERLNQYLRMHPNAPVLLCSRVYDYEQLNKNNRVATEGAVTLEDLTDEQIDDYLKAARADSLLQTLPQDESLRELARTPLTLSMMTLAYAGVSTQYVMPATNYFERRRQLFDFYVTRMMQRAVRKGNPQIHTETLNPEADLPTPYNRAQVDRYLGWIATRMIERSANAYPDQAPYKFLHSGKVSWKPWTVHHLASVIVTLIASTLLIIIASMAMGLTLVEAIGTSILCIGIFGISYITFVTIDILAKKKKAKYQAVYVGLQNLLTYVVVFSIPFIMMISFGMSLNLNNILKVNNVMFEVVPDGSGLSQSVLLEQNIHLTIGLPLASAILLLFLSIVILIGLYIDSDNSDNKSLSVSEFVIIVGALGGLFILGAANGLAVLLLYYVIGPMLPLIGLSILMGMEANTGGGDEPIHATVFFLVIGGLAIIGKFILGTFGALLVGIWAPVLLFFYVTDEKPTILPKLKSAVVKSIAIVSYPVIYEPVMKLCLWISDTLPKRWKKFNEFVHEALFLKHNDQGLTFIHRLLRDHFAITILSHVKTEHPYSWLGERYLAAKDYAAALDAFNLAVDTGLAQTEARLGIARTLLLMQDKIKALNIVNHAIYIDSHDAAAYVVRATINWALKDNIGAEEDWKLAYQLGKPGESISRIDLLKLEPSLNNIDSSIYNLLPGKLEDSHFLLVLNALLAKDPKDIEVLIMRAMLHVKLKNDKAALKDFIALIRVSHNLAGLIGTTFVDAKKAEFHSQSARFLMRFGLYEDALLDLDFLIRSTWLWRFSPDQKQDRIKWLQMRAQAYESLNRYLEALKDYNLALRVDKENKKIIEAKSRLFGQMGQKK